MSDTPRTFKMIAYAPTGLKINPAFNQAVDLCEQLEIELNAANERIKRLEEELERTKQDRNAIAKNTREPLLLKLDRAAERIKRLEEAGDAVEERLGCGCGCGGPCRVCQSASGNWFEAKEAKP